jgi:hypothetical protein
MCGGLFFLSKVKNILRDGLGIGICMSTGVRFGWLDCTVSEVQQELASAFVLTE